MSSIPQPDSPRTDRSPPDQRRADVFPRLPLIGVALAMAIAIGGATAMRIAGGPGVQPTTTPVAVRELRFADQPDGGIVVTDAADGHTLEVLAPASNGFIRATMRVLAQQRLRNADGPQIPFKLTAWSDGRLTLDDPDTGRRIDLEAFGHTNVEAFAHLLPRPASAADAPGPATDHAAPQPAANRQAAR